MPTLVNYNCVPQQRQADQVEPLSTRSDVWRRDRRSAANDARGAVADRPAGAGATVPCRHRRAGARTYAWTLHRFGVLVHMRDARQKGSQVRSPRGRRRRRRRHAGADLLDPHRRRGRRCGSGEVTKPSTPPRRSELGRAAARDERRRDSRRRQASTHSTTRARRLASNCRRASAGRWIETSARSSAEPAPTGEPAAPGPDARGPAEAGPGPRREADVSRGGLEPADRAEVDAEARRERHAA